MHVVLLSRSTLFSQRGGDTIQILRTSEALKALEMDVTIVLHGETLPDEPIDLIHFFNIGRPADALPYLKSTSCPWVVSTIDVDYDAFDQGRGIMKSLSSNAREYFKTIARGLYGTDKMPSFRYWWLGHKRSQLALLQRAKMLVTTSHKEAERLLNKWGELPPIQVILPGVQDIFKHQHPEVERKGILCVGRIEGIKNQLELIRAMNDISEPLQLIGAGSRNQNGYLLACENEAGDHVTFTPHQTPDALALAYASHAVLVVPSLFETFGFTALEGLASGCAVVLSESAESFDLLREFVFPCAPNEHSIRQAILRALEEGPKPGGKEFARNLTWNDTAEALQRTYTSILS